MRVECQLKFSALLCAEFESGRICSILITFLRYKKIPPLQKDSMLRDRKVMNFVGRGIEQRLQEERCFSAAAMARLHKLYSWETTQIAVIHQLVVVSQTGHFPQDPTDQPCSIACLQR